MIFFTLRFSKFRSPHCILTLKLLHQHCHLCWTNMLHSKTFHVHPRLKNITPDIRSEKANRSKLETIYRSSRRPSDFQSFKKQSIIVHKLISDSRRSYYRSLILARKDYPRKLVYFEFPSFSQYTIMFAFFFMCFYPCCLISKNFYDKISLQFNLFSHTSETALLRIQNVFKTSTTCYSSNWPGSNHTTSSAFVFRSINGGGGQKSLP